MLTARQQEIWNFLVEYVDRHGYPPTVREIGERVGLASPSTVHAHLANLERAGLLKRDPSKPRALELLGREKKEAAPAAAPVERDDVQRLPLLGEIAAGGLLLAEQSVEDYMTVPEELADSDVAILIATAAADAGAAATIGAAAAERGIMCSGLVLGERAEVMPTIAALRPYARNLMATSDEDDVAAVLTALRA